MGSQICFFITPNDFAYLLDKTLSYDIIILDKYGEEITPGELYSKIEYGYERKICHSDNYYFTKNGFNISYFSDSGLLDFQKSEVIQFSFCKNSPPKILDKSTIDQRFLKNGFIGKSGDGSVINKNQQNQGTVCENCPRNFYLQNTCLPIVVTTGRDLIH